MAVRSARLTREKLGHKGTEGLLPIQKQIYEYIKANKEIPREEQPYIFN